MNAPAKVAADNISLLAKLREPFAPHQISKLPKETKAQIEARRSDKNLMVWKCEVCGGAHHKNATHLDYVGHAALTDRLLDTDIEWSWEPVAFTPEGLPAFDRNNGLWIKLTVGGVSRLGYGAADGKSGGDAIKEIIGDALRNAAMRFGAALDLWHKGDLHADDELDNNSEPNRKTGVKLNGPITSITGLEKAIKAFAVDMGKIVTFDEWYVLKNANADLLTQAERDHPDWWNGWNGQPDGFTPLRRRIEILEAELAEQEKELA